MTVVVDTGLVVALLDARDPHHEAAAGWVATLDEDLVTTPLAVAEMDHFALSRGGDEGRGRLWTDFEVGAYIVRWWADGMQDTLRAARSYPFAGLSDASLVALAGLLRTDRIATFDRHFRSMTTLDGDPFVLLPDDA